MDEQLLTLGAPTQVWSTRGGQVRLDGVLGVHHGDRRLLAELVLTLDGAGPTPVGHHSTSGASPPPSPFLGTWATLARPDGPGRAPASGVGTDELTWSDGGLRALLHDPGGQHLPRGRRRRGHLAGRGRARRIGLSRDPHRPSRWLRATTPARGGLDVDSAEHRLGRVVAPCLDDLRLLCLAVPAADDDEEDVAARAPWFLTLFGRDSLWTARMLLPLTTAMAGYS